jgi:proteasome lid subunit RPN8/RPN11
LLARAGQPARAKEEYLRRAVDCAFPVEWSAAVLEEIRQAAVDAFFSLPHGGVEIGGVLFGRREGGGVRILAHRALACEHALGPSFTLSENDQARLRELLRDPEAPGLEPVGWYHSHTRSEMVLSDRDLEIHDRWFPHPWQVALVVRPHALKPARAGLFVRAADGSMRAESSGGEFVLQPPAAAPATEPPAASAPEPPLPAFLTAPPPKRSWRWLGWAAAVVALGAGGFAFRSGWMPVLARDPAPSASLLAFDLDGQLQIRWDRGSEPVRSAAGGTLEIADGAARTAVALDGRRLKSGTFSYARQTARVDVRLALDRPDGGKFEEFTCFLGQAPASKPSPEEAAAEAARLRQELRDQAARARQLRRTIDDMRAALVRERRRATWP